MKDNDKNQKQLIKELTQLRQRIAELETSERQRNQFEETLRTERDKAQQYLDIAEVMLVVLDKKGNIALINRKGNQILGYKDGELLGKNWFTTCLPAHVRKGVKGVFLKLMAGEGEITEFYENPVLTKSGTERMIAWHNTLLKDAQGKNIDTLSSGMDITERKRAEEALKESESRFRNIIESSKDGIIFFDGKTQKILFGNITMAELLGCSKEDLAGRSISSLHPSEEWASIKQEFQKHVRGELSLSTGIPVLRNDGSVFYADISTSFIMLEGKTYFSAFFCDITERKQAEEIILRSEKRFKTLYQESPIPTFTWQKKGGDFFLVDFNRAAILLTEGKAGTYMGNTALELYRKRSEIIDDMLRCFKEQSSIRRELVSQNFAPGRFLSVYYSYIPPDLIIIHAEDITERKQAEEKLRESETRFRTLFEAIPDTILVHDDEGTILHINEIGAQQLEWSVKDLVGRNLREIVTPENRVSIADHIRETHTAGWSRFEITYVSRSGWQIIAEVNDRPIKFGKEKAILSVARDITKRKEAEDALLREIKFSDAVMNSSPGLLFVFGDKGNIIQWNRNVENVTGYSASEIAKMNVLDFVVKEDKKNAAEAVQEVLTKGQSSVEIDVLTKPGKKIPFFITGRVTKIENATCVVCTGIDITERKQAEEEVKRGYEQLRETLISTVNALASTVEMRDPYTAGHQRRETILACAIAEEMSLSEGRIEGIRMAGAIHDIGKIVVPAEILSKPGPLTKVQYEMVKMHPQVGYDILKGIKFPWPVAEIVFQHHERMDGSGYPHGVKGEEIILEARILAVADVVEAMSSHRPYRPSLGIDKALEEISQNRGVLYDPDVVDACVRLFAEKGFKLE